MITVINTLTGLVVQVSEKTLNHPVLGKNLTRVDETTKSYVAAMYEPKSVEEFTEVKSKRSKKSDNETDEVAVELVAESFDNTEDE